eukprot:maker-scaffold_24-snap-gene-3.35-mRNA-1 protein AED:0.01 eAED:0.01 QI:0/0/0/1/0/0/2/70/62
MKYPVNISELTDSISGMDRLAKKKEKKIRMKDSVCPCCGEGCNCCGGDCGSCSSDCNCCGGQ